MTREEMKKEAIKRMKMLKILKTPIVEFEEEDKLNLSEAIGFLYWLNDEQKEMVREFEVEHNAVVYHVIHQFTNIGELYNLLYVSSYDEELEMDNEDLKNGHTIAYVVNASMPDCSEFGTIGVKPCNGGVIRIW